MWLIIVIVINFTVMRMTPNWLHLHVHIFALFPKRRYFPTKVFTWIMKVNILLIFLFTCSRAKCRTCLTVRTQPTSFIHSTTFLKRLALRCLCISKNLLMWKSFIMFKSCVSLCFLLGTNLYCSLVNCWIVGLCTTTIAMHRADHKP